jgi:hypothetical protein
MGQVIFHGQVCQQGTRFIGFDGVDRVIVNAQMIRAQQLQLQVWHSILTKVRRLLEPHPWVSNKSWIVMSSHIITFFHEILI